MPPKAAPTICGLKSSHFVILVGIIFCCAAQFLHHNMLQNSKARPRNSLWRNFDLLQRTSKNTTENAGLLARASKLEKLLGNQTKICLELVGGEWHIQLRDGRGGRGEEEATARGQDSLHPALIDAEGKGGSVEARAGRGADLSSKALAPLNSPTVQPTPAPLPPFGLLPANKASPPSPAATLAPAPSPPPPPPPPAKAKQSAAPTAPSPSSPSSSSSAVAPPPSIPKQQPLLSSSLPSPHPSFVPSTGAIADHPWPSDVPAIVLEGKDPTGFFQDEEWEYRQGPLVQSTLKKLTTPEKAIQAGHVYTHWDRRRFTNQGGATRIGFYVKPGKDPSVVKRIWIWGERNSCTTVVTDILLKNFAAGLGCQDKPCVKGGMPWKHAFMREADLSSQDTTLHILVTRHPYAWAKSMRSHPFYAPLHEKLSMQDFLTLEWISFKDNPGKYGSRSHLKPKKSPRQPDPLPDMGRANTAPGTSDGKCETAQHLKPGGTCEHEGRDYQCVTVPGMEVTGTVWKHPPLGCLSEQISSTVTCRKPQLLCEVGMKRPWDREFMKWKAGVANRVPGFPSPEPGSLYLPPPEPKSNEICGVLEKAGGGRGSVRVGTCKNIRADMAGAVGKAETVYACTQIPEYQVLHGHELAPSTTCLGGQEAWNQCDRGRFFCELGKPQRWTGKSSTEWDVVKRALDELNSLQPPGAGTVSAGGKATDELMQDRDQDTMGRLPNVMAMRAAKVRDWFKVTARLDYSTHVACQDFFLDPTEIMHQLIRAYKLRPESLPLDLSSCTWVEGRCQQSSDWYSPEQEKKRQAYLHGGFMKVFDAHSLATLNAWADPVLEASLGYTLFEDLQKASTPYTKESRCTLHLPESLKPYYCPPGAPVLQVG